MRRPSGASAYILSLSYVGLSLVGLVVLALSTFSSPVSRPRDPYLQRELMGSIFVAICVAGIVGCVFPSSCSPRVRFTGRKKADEREKGDQQMSAEFLGHHPVCGSFSAHVLRHGDKTYCAGCTGLIVGAVFSLFVISSYLFLGFDTGGRNALVFWIGFVAVACGLLQYQIPRRDKWVIHFLLNVAFALGTSLLLIGVNEITGDLVLEAYLLALMIFWIAARIMISQLEHRRICRACLRSCNYYQTTISVCDPNRRGRPPR